MHGISLEYVMLSEQMEQLFYGNGYYKIASNLPEYTFYCRKENQGTTILFVIDYRQGLWVSEDQYAHLKHRIAGFMKEKGEEDVHILTLILSADTEKAKKLCISDSFCWMIDVVSKRLIIHENQVPDFYGWKGLLEEYLAVLQQDENRSGDGGMENPGNPPESGGTGGNFGGGKSGRKYRSRRQIAEMSWVTVGLVAVNVIVFLICTFTGDLLYNIGAVSVRDVLEEGAYYQVLSSMFLHWDVNHLFSNMIVLYYIGEIVEKKTGHLSYALIYFLSGIMGNVFSMGYELLTEQYYSSAGASGAVFGVEGALFLLLIIHRGKMEQMTVGRLAFSIVFSLYCGFTSAGVNNAAHIGGVLMGFAVTAVIMMLRPHAGTGKDRGFNES